MQQKLDFLFIQVRARKNQSLLRRPELMKFKAVLFLSWPPSRPVLPRRLSRLSRAYGWIPPRFTASRLFPADTACIILRLRAIMAPPVF